MGLSCSTCFPRFKCLMNSAMPPLYLNSAVLCSPVLDSVAVNMLLSGRKRTLVPRFLVAPAFFSLLVGSPLEYVCSQVKPSRQISSSSSSLSAFTQETPTPCSPPETLYDDESNLPPACNLVITTCAADTFSPSMSMESTGMPRPLSTTVMELSICIVTSILSAYPASASSTELSTTS